MKKALFVCYGGGHVRMLLPVARLLRERGLADVQMLALTTAAPAVREAGLPLLRFSDFLEPGDAPALARGQALAEELGGQLDAAESAAYLGLCYADLAREHGEAEAARRYAEKGRQAFLPRHSLRRILRRVAPDLLIATNAPRAERAAIEVAREMGIPALCLVDLFAIDEVAWIGQPGYAERVLVLNQAVRQFLVDHGRRADEIVVTGNPAFDALCAPETKAAGRALRDRMGWRHRRVVLWAEQDEPMIHPFDGRRGDPALPQRVRQRLLAWALAHGDAVLCVRPRPGQRPPDISACANALLTGQDWALPPLLHAVDLVVTLTSTVGLEGRLAGTRLVQVRGSVFDDAMPLARFGLADAAVAEHELDSAVSTFSAAGRHPVAGGASAAERVLSELRAFL